MLKAPISPYVVAGRILSIIGMSFFTATGILFCIGGFWFWGLGALIGFVPFLALIVAVERYSTKHGLIGTLPARQNQQPDVSSPGDGHEPPNSDRGDGDPSP